MGEPELQVLGRKGTLVGIFLLLAATCRGQVTGGASVTRQVVVQQGGTIQNTSVILLNRATGHLQETSTDQN